MAEYPVKEVVLKKIYTTHVHIRSNTNKEALDKVYELGSEGKLEEKFTDSPSYDTSIWSAHKEGIINEEFILKECNTCNDNSEQPNYITFKSAVQAYQNGKTIYSYYPNGTCYNEYTPKVNSCGDLIFNEIEIWEILEGKWSIKNE